MPSAATNGTSGANDINDLNGNSSSASCSVDEFISHPFDYVIIGGGTAGLCLAARLREDPNVHVGVLEAGEIDWVTRMSSRSLSYLSRKTGL